MAVQRARLARVVLNSAGEPQANKAVTVYKADGTTPFNQTMYDAVSGGGVVTSPTTNSEGLVELWAPLGQRVKLLVAGDSGQVNGGFLPDEEDIIVKDDDDRVTLPKRLTITSEGLVVTAGGVEVAAGGATITEGGLSVAAGGASIIRSDAANYALSATQQNAAGLIARFVGSGGTAVAQILNTGLYFIDAASATGQGAKVALGAAGIGNRIAVVTTFSSADATAQGSGSFINISSAQTVTHSTGDHAGVNSHIHCTAVGAAGAVKAFEGYAKMGPDATSHSGCWGFEIGSASVIASPANTIADLNVGIYIKSATSDTGYVGAAIPQDSGIVITSVDGWRNYLIARAANAGFAGAAKFRVAGGYLTMGGVADQDGDVVSAARWRGGDGTALLPAITFDGDVDTGLYRHTTNGVSMSTAGTQRTIWTAAGSVRLAGSALLGNATDGFPYIPFMAAAPSGAPTAIGGVPMVFDTVNSKLWIHNSSAWVGVVLS